MNRHASDQFAFKVRHRSLGPEWRLRRRFRAVRFGVIHTLDYGLGRIRATSPNAPCVLASPRITLARMPHLEHELVSVDRMRVRATLHFAVVFALALALHGVAALPAHAAIGRSVVRIIAAGPVVDGSDGPALPTWYRRVTISPDADGIDDLATMAICARPGTSVTAAVVAWERFGGWTPVWTSQPVRTRAQVSAGRRGPCGPDAASPVRFAWSGTLADGSPAPDGPYVLTACRSSKLASVRTARPVGVRRWKAGAGDGDDESIGAPVGRRVSQRNPAGIPRGAARGCIQAPILVHVRRLSVAVTTPQSVEAGGAIPITIEADVPSVTVSLVQADSGTEVVSLGPVPIPLGGHEAVGVRLVVPSMLPSNLYRVLVTGSGGVTRSVPVVVRSPIPLAQPMENTALVVWPYLTWRSYNRFDADRDGLPDTWYQNWRRRLVTMAGPYENGPLSDIREGAEGDEPHARGFASWLSTIPTDTHVQSITDIDLSSLDRESLRRYGAIVFPGHTEYYETRTWDLLRDYRDGGGHLIFLSSNNFFRQVSTVQRDGWIVMTQDYARTVERSDFSLVGVGYSCCIGTGVGVQVIAESAGIEAAPWAFVGTGITMGGDIMGIAGREVDTLDPAMSPPSTISLAIGDFAPVGMTARSNIAWTQLPRGGEVFATGNMHFVAMLSSGDESERQRSTKMLENVWDRFVDG